MEATSLDITQLPCSSSLSVQLRSSSLNVNFVILIENFSADLSLRSDPASNTSRCKRPRYRCPQLPSAPAAIYPAPHVGDLNISVSDTIAAHNSPAMCLGTSNTLYIHLRDCSSASDWLKIEEYRLSVWIVPACGDPHPVARTYHRVVQCL